MSERRASDRSGQRCPVCGNAGWLDRHGDDECTHCRLVVRHDADLAGVVEDIAARLARGTIDLVAVPPPDWTLDPAGLRNVAWRFGYELEPLADGTGFDPGDRPGRAIARPAARRPHDVTLGMMTHAADAPAAAALIHEIGGHFARIVMMVDGTEDLAHAIAVQVPCATVVAHALGGDFAAQRNRVQDLANDKWVLQLDSDERPDALLLDSLGWITRAADRDGLRSLGLARRNIVGGTQSALFPDIQYRLNHAAIRFAGVVHERPVTEFAKTSLALSGALEHRLDAARVVARTRLYEGMSAGGGRPEDEALLLRPFDPIAER